MNELLIPGIFGYDVQRNLTRLQDIIDDNHLSILNVMNLVCTENIHYAYTYNTYMWLRDSQKNLRNYESILLCD